MTIALTERAITADELIELPDDAGVRYELSRGRLICTAYASYLPGQIGGRIMTDVFSFVKAHQLGEAGSGDTGFRLASQRDTVRAPDAWFIRAERIHAAGAFKGFFPGPPDLAIEVLSPSDRFQLVAGRIRDYMESGTPLLWVFDPEAQHVTIFRPNQPVRFLDATDTLDGEDVLPRFTLPLTALCA